MTGRFYIWRIIERKHCFWHTLSVKSKMLLGGQNSTLTPPPTYVYLWCCPLISEDSFFKSVDSTCYSTSASTHAPDDQHSRFLHQPLCELRRLCSRPGVQCWDQDPESTGLGAHHLSEHTLPRWPTLPFPAPAALRTSSPVLATWCSVLGSGPGEHRPWRPSPQRAHTPPMTNTPVSCTSRSANFVACARDLVFSVGIRTRRAQALAPITSASTHSPDDQHSRFLHQPLCELRRLCSRPGVQCWDQDPESTGLGAHQTRNQYFYFRPRTEIFRQTFCVFSAEKYHFEKKRKRGFRKNKIPENAKNTIKTTIFRAPKARGNFWSSKSAKIAWNKHLLE